MLKTMAMKITKENWPIAVAVLGSNFASINTKCTIGSYLIINALPGPIVNPAGAMVGEVDECDDRPRTRYDQMIPPGYRRINRYGVITLTNFWSSKKMFKKEFEPVGEVADKTQFFEVTRR